MILVINLELDIGNIIMESHVLRHTVGILGNY